MKSSRLFYLLAAVLVLGLSLATLLLVIGPKRVERRAIDLFRTQQALVAEQGARRLAETFRDVQTRLEEATQRLRLYDDPDVSPDDPAEQLRRLSHPRDRESGLVLLLTSNEGDVLAVEPGIDAEKRRTLSDQKISVGEFPREEPIRVCARCVGHGESAAVIAPLDDGRQLVALFDLGRLLGDIFGRITKGRQAHAVLLDREGNVLYEDRSAGTPIAGELVSGTAPLPGSGWRVRVETPRAAVAPEIAGAVRTVLYASVGLLVLFTLALGVLTIRGRREHAERLERTEALAKTDKLATVGMLASSITHEIRNIVSAVQMNLELIRRSGSDDLEKYVEKADEAVDRLDGLSKTVTGYARSDGSETARTRLRQPVEEAIDLVEPKLDEGILDVDYRANPRIRASSSALTHVLVNLLLNAYDAVSDTPDGRILVRVDRVGDETGIIEVADDGAGIDPSLLGDLFDPFTSTKQDDPGAEGGTGLGLWLCSEIVRQRGGRISAENRENGGARFTVRLPISKTGADADEAMEPSEDSATDTAPPAAEA